MVALREALEFSSLVKHRNGDPGIDELWGEPFKAFIMSVDDFYETRYIKIGMTMKNIDQAADYMERCIKNDPRFPGLDQLIRNYAEAARRKCETLRTDDDIFDVWSDFVVAGEEVTDFVPEPDVPPSDEPLIDVLDVKHMLKTGVRLIAFITRARTPMPKSTANFLSECELYKKRAC